MRKNLLIGCGILISVLGLVTVLFHLSPDLAFQAADLHGGQIAFTRGEGSAQEIYVIDSNGQNEQRLTNNYVWDGELSWSPDGKRIAFVRSIPTRTRVIPDGYYPATDEIWVMSADGTEPRRLVVGLVTREDADYEGWKEKFPNMVGPLAHIQSLYWSPDGKRLLFESMGAVTNDQLVSLAAAHPVLEGPSFLGNDLQVTSEGEVISWFHAYQPDLLVGTVNQFIVRDTQLQRIRVLRELENCEPYLVSPDGAKVLVSLSPARRSSYGSGVFLYSRGDGTLRRLEGISGLVAGIDGKLAGAWSPNGTRIAYLSDRGSGLGLYVYDLATDAEVQLSELDVYLEQPSWSPDGGRLAFVSDRNGNPDIYVYVLDAEGGYEYQLTADPVPDLSPRWRPERIRHSWQLQEVIITFEPLTTQSRKIRPPRS